jgi:hypothetical protein
MMSYEDVKPVVGAVPEHASRFTIRTSDRRLFRRCFRKWGYLSSLKMNLQATGAEQNINFWFGSAIHFALEDYHGWNKFGDPRRALKAYYDAFKIEDLPEGASVYYDLGIGMLTHYLEWFEAHNKTFEFQTLWLDENMQEAVPFAEGAHPAVEQRFFLDLGIKALVNKKTHRVICECTPDVEKNLQKQQITFRTDYASGDITFDYWYAVNGNLIQVDIVPVFYHGTMDKIMKDNLGRWWICDYKTAKKADTNKLETDDQISAYLWAAEQWFDHPIYGFAYLQITKTLVHAPKRNKDMTLSVDKKQATTYRMLKKELIDDYGTLEKCPNKYIDFLNVLAEHETPEGDKFIRWDLVQRSAEQSVATYNNIIGELKLMLRPDLYLFPNPTRDCIWDCPLRDVCIAQDAGLNDDVQRMLDSNYTERPRGEEGNNPEWEKNIKWPDAPLPPVDPTEFQVDPELDLNVILPDEYFADFE